jgi:hypothetical protein
LLKKNKTIPFRVYLAKCVYTPICKCGAAGKALGCGSTPSDGIKCNNRCKSSLLAVRKAIRCKITVRVSTEGRVLDERQTGWWDLTSGSTGPDSLFEKNLARKPDTSVEGLSHTKGKKKRGRKPRRAVSVFILDSQFDLELKYMCKRRHVIIIHTAMLQKSKVQAQSPNTNCTQGYFCRKN